MSRKIVSILALLCFLVIGNSAMASNWSPNTTWHGGQGNNDWFSAANWWVSDTDPNAVPDINYQALIEPKTPNPRIDGNATCGYLNIMPWSWPDATVEFSPSARAAGRERSLEGSWMGQAGPLLLLVSAASMARRTDFGQPSEWDFQGMPQMGQHLNGSMFFS